MCLPTLFDLLVDLYVSVRYTDTEVDTKHDHSRKIVRLSLLERSCFILGCITEAFYFLFPLQDVMLLYIVNAVFAVLNILLTQVRNMNNIKTDPNFTAAIFRSI